MKSHQAGEDGLVISTVSNQDSTLRYSRAGGRSFKSGHEASEGAKGPVVGVNPSHLHRELKGRGDLHHFSFSSMLPCGLAGYLVTYWKTHGLN